MDGRLHRLLISYLPVSVNDFLWVVFFLGAYVTAGTKGLEVLHYTLGYSMSALIIIRIFFGLADKGYTNIIEWFQDPVEFISDLRTRLKLELSLPPESGSHNEMHNLVYGRISDEKDKGAVYAGI
jgi:cytochrome b